MSLSLNNFCDLTASFVDNSVTSEYRITRNKIIPIQKLQFLNEILTKFHIKIEDFFFTERLFIELIGHGNIRYRIQKKHVKTFDVLRKTALDALQSSESNMLKIIPNLIEQLKKLFRRELYTILPQKIVYSNAHKNLKKYEFIQEFRSFKTKLIRYGKDLTKEVSEYETLINVLVEDSVVRYALDLLDIRQISPNLHDKFFLFTNLMLRMLMVEYHHSEIQYSNLNLLMSVLKDCIEGKISHNQKSQPLFRVCNDLVDVELSHYSLCGKNINRTLAAVTVITGEPEQTVKDRLKYNFQAIGTKAQIIGEQKLMMGRTIILDFTSYTYKELVTKEFISENFKYVSGRPIFQNPA